ncbi:hypothetical protein G7Y89_g4855 [Cudoniella acicularis]|uniref:Uncharacterized protein n=1 Tax=Cudoniella acicularis TaxID=354080 RepID=A0A8H4RQN3_9HELO|nr:hypothetical protein G7Y89_g4855 [Cudoniella acicularis]
MGPQPGQYRNRSPVTHNLHQEPVYRARTPQPAAEEVVYDRAPRQDYRRVYAEEPRPREPQYAEAYELVRVSDSQGDYFIRRPVRREPEPVYAAYEDDTYTRQPVYESRPPVSRSDPTFYEEEYDPRHPQAPPPAPARQFWTDELGEILAVKRPKIKEHSEKLKLDFGFQSFILPTHPKWDSINNLKLTSRNSAGLNGTSHKITHNLNALQGSTVPHLMGRDFEISFEGHLQQGTLHEGISTGVLPCLAENYRMGLRGSDLPLLLLQDGIRHPADFVN